MADILKSVSNALSLPPFNKQISSIQLDSLPAIEILDLIILVTRQIDSNLDLGHDEIPKIVDLLVILNFDNAAAD